jgi:hypothetical protein
MNLAKVHPMLGCVTDVQGVREGTIANAINRALDREHPPARMTAAQAADFLGFEKDDLALFAREELLRPLGRPVANATKYYAAVEVVAFWKDRERLDRATQLIYERNRSKVEAQRDREMFSAKPRGTD